MSSSTTKIAVLFQNLLWEIWSTTRPTARSLSASSATGSGSPEPAPAVWSVISHMNVRPGIFPVCSCCLNIGSHMSTRYWSGILSWKFGNHGSSDLLFSEGMSLAASWTC